MPNIEVTPVGLAALIPLGLPAKSNTPLHAVEVAPSTEVVVSLHQLQIWYFASSGRLHPISACNELHILAEGRMRELAAEAIKTGSTAVSTILSPDPVWLVAQPVKQAAQEATCGLIALYHGVANESVVNAIRTSLIGLHMLGNHLHATQREADQQAAGPMPASPTGSPYNAALATPPTWSELGRNLSRRLACSLAVAWRQKRFYLFATLGLLGLGSIPAPYRIQCNVVCEPATRRFVAAPFDSTLVVSHVAIGEQVTLGQNLATLDGRDLRSQLAGLEAEYAQQNQKKLAAVRTREHSQAELARLQAEQLATEIDIVQHKLASLEIRSPIDGVIVGGDLEGVAGAPLKLGETLYEIGQLGTMVAEVQVPEVNVNAVEVGAQVTITLDSFGGHPFRTSIQNIHPRSEMLANQSVFIAEAEVPAEEFELKPGMHGSATISAGYRSLGWQLLHRPLYRVRQFFGW